MNRDTKFHIVNSLIAGGLVFFGSFTGSGYKFNWDSIVLSLAAASLVALTKFAEWFKNQDPSNKIKNKKARAKLFSFVG